MLYLREVGIGTYDFGGVAVGAEVPALKGINDFKIGFGGTLVREDHWYSLLYALGSLARAR
jgi:lipid II:glycine glycyltransferase (peptidoglycan interpeptide bridge formation enzyme)